jgi:hypothetical protein
MIINWFALTIMVMWISAAIGTAFSKDSQCFGTAAIVSLLMGVGYLIMGGH